MVLRLTIQHLTCSIFILYPYARLDSTSPRLRCLTPSIRHELHPCCPHDLRSKQVIALYTAHFGHTRLRPLLQTGGGYLENFSSPTWTSMISSYMSQRPFACQSTSLRLHKRLSFPNLDRMHLWFLCFRLGYMNVSINRRITKSASTS